jgi:hypothetical protein
MDGILLPEHVRIAERSLWLDTFLIDKLSFRLSMALELAKHNPVYEDIASKFFEVSFFSTPLDVDKLTCHRSTSSSSQMP